MAMKAVIRTIGKFVSIHQRKIFLVTNIAGTFVTTCLAVEAGYRSCDTVRRVKAEAESEGKDISKKDIVVACAPHFTLAAVSLAATTACGIAGHVSANREIAASSALAAASDLALNEIRDGLKKKLGNEKAELMEGDIHRDTVIEHMPYEDKITITPYGADPIYDAFCDRWFTGSVEHIKKVQNEMNKRIINEIYVEFNEVYAELGLKEAELGRGIGWDTAHFIDFDFKSYLDDYGHPYVWLGHHQRPINPHTSR